ILSSHYRGPINYSLDQLEQADAALGRIYTALRDLPAGEPPVQSEHTARFHESMDDDFNTPEAIAVLQALTREINSARAAGRDEKAKVLGAELRALASVLGIAQIDPAEWFRRSGRIGQVAAGAGSLSDDEVESRIQARIAA